MTRLLRTMRSVIFDLDGTICDSGAIIVDCLSQTLRAHGHGAHDTAVLMGFVGTSLRETFAALTGLPETKTAPLVRHYRSEYSKVMGRAPVYPGMSSLIRRLHHAGYHLAIATSKLESQAKEILGSIGLAEYFAVVSGSTADGCRTSKDDIVGAAIRRMNALGVDTSGAVMIGDRIHDVAAAQTHGLASVFVRWGYGPEEEGRCASMVASTVAELGMILTGPPREADARTGPPA